MEITTVADVPPLTRLFNDFRERRGDHGRPLSSHEAARLTDYAVSYETFRKIANGAHSGRISEETVRALVRLGMDEREVRRAAGQQITTSPGPFRLPPRADRLTPSQRAVVTAVANAILDAAERSERTNGRARRTGPPSPQLREARELIGSSRLDRRTKAQLLRLIEPAGPAPASGPEIQEEPAS